MHSLPLLTQCGAMLLTTGMILLPLVVDKQNSYTTTKETSQRQTDRQTDRQQEEEEEEEEEEATAGASRARGISAMQDKQRCMPPPVVISW